mgnify:CR=1 FL=1
MRTLTQIREAGGPAADLTPNDEQDKERQDKGAPRAKGEKKFKDAHKGEVINHPVAADHQHTGGSKFGGEHEKAEGGGEKNVKQGSSDNTGRKEDGSKKADSSPAARKRVGDLMAVKQGSSKITEEFIEEGIIDDLKKIAGQRSAKRIRFKNGKTEMVDAFTASAVVGVYEKVNKQNQAKMAKMAETLPGFMKLMDFAMSKVK